MANPKQTDESPNKSLVSGKYTTVDKPTKQPCAPGGDVTVNQCSVPSFDVAEKLLSTPDSCLVKNTHRRHIALPPVYLNKKRTGLREELEAELLMYSQSLKGVPLAYDDIKIVAKHGDIIDDSGYIHMDVEANFIVFQPQIGQKLLGKVNKLGSTHVGCLVHGCFNASIPKPNLLPADIWREAGPGLNTELEFEVTALDTDTAGVLLIRGRLYRTRVQELLAMADSAETGNSTNQQEPLGEEQTLESSRDNVKKDRVKEKETSCQQEGVKTGDIDHNEISITKKKKKRKEKVLKEVPEEVELSSLETQNSDYSSNCSDRHCKKRKHAAESNEALTHNANPESPVSKKKKKRNIV